jgi:hypothetical protein
VWYLGNPTVPAVAEAMRAGLLGCVDTPMQRNILPAGITWAADNGVYGKGWPGYDNWYRWLTAHPADRSRCLFAVAPDVVADAAATLTRSAPWLPRIRELGYPSALAAQDGLEDMTVPWDEFDVLFLGGTTAWKLGPAARRLTAEAKAKGLAVHMGRVNSLRRLRYATAIGCDSADGTYLKYGPDTNLPKALGWVHDVRNQGGLFSIIEPTQGRQQGTAQAG